MPSWKTWILFTLIGTAFWFALDHWFPEMHFVIKYLLVFIGLFGAHFLWANIQKWRQKKK